jgi:hypothetical protein
VVEQGYVVSEAHRNLHKPALPESDALNISRTSSAHWFNKVQRLNHGLDRVDAVSVIMDLT